MFFPWLRSPCCTFQHFHLRCVWWHFNAACLNVYVTFSVIITMGINASQRSCKVCEAAFKQWDSQKQGQVSINAQLSCKGVCEKWKRPEGKTITSVCSQKTTPTSELNLSRHTPQALGFLFRGEISPKPGPIRALWTGSICNNREAWR